MGPTLGRVAKASRARAGGRLWSLDPQCLCETAKRRTGLYDFGEPAVEPGLAVLAESLEQEAQLHPLGRMLMRIHLLELLQIRLQLNAEWKAAGPSLAAQTVSAPLFIVGMPRSGSTFVHELLAEDPAHRAPRVWELMFPVPARRGGRRERTRRIRKAAFCLWCFRMLARGADAVYPMRALTPHECVAIHSYTFLSEEFISTCHIPAYERFLHGTDLTPVYAWQKRFLQYLQLGCPAHRWVLKSPDHVHGLEALFRTFPDARIIQTHRNPFEVLKSSAELTRVLRGLYGPAGDPDDIRAREARVLAEGTERFLQFRDAHPELANRFVDVKYSELVADPPAALRRVYSELAIPLSDEAAGRMQRLAASRSRYSGRRASAEPKALKLKASRELERFRRYCSRFDLPFYDAELD